MFAVTDALLSMVISFDRYLVSRPSTDQRPTAPAVGVAGSGSIRDGSRTPPAGATRPPGLTSASTKPAAVSSATSAAPVRAGTPHPPWTTCAMARLRASGPWGSAAAASSSPSSGARSRPPGRSAAYAVARAPGRPASAKKNWLHVTASNRPSRCTALGVGAEDLEPVGDTEALRPTPRLGGEVRVELHAHRGHLRERLERAEEAARHTAPELEVPAGVVESRPERRRRPRALAHQGDDARGERVRGHRRGVGEPVRRWEVGEAVATGEVDERSSGDVVHRQRRRQGREGRGTGEHLPVGREPESRTRDGRRRLRPPGRRRPARCGSR